MTSLLYTSMYFNTVENLCKTSDEIEAFLWYDSACRTDILSNALKNEVIPYCLLNNLTSILEY